MSCPFHDTDAVDRGPLQNSERRSGLARRWHTLWCLDCRQAQAAQRRLDRGLAQMQAETLPETGLNRLLDALGLPALPGLTEAERVRLKANLRRLLFLIGIVLFVTTLMQPEVIGRKAVENGWFGQSRPNALQTSGLWLLLGMAWYVRPMLALGVQGMSRFRKPASIPVCRWLVGSAFAAACLWLALGGNPARGLSVALLIGISGMLALASTVMGGLLVEQGQRMGATGRLGALHAGAIFLARLSGAGITGVLDADSLHRIIPFCAVLLVGFALLCRQILNKVLRQEAADAPQSALSETPSVAPALTRQSEEQTTRRESAATSVRALFGSKNVGGAACIALLIYIAPNFASLQYQENLRLGFDLRAQDGLDFIGGACGLIGVGGYLFLCRRLPLQTLLNVGIVCNTLGTLLYLGYHSVPTAFIIEGANGLLSALVFAMLFDLAIRAIPRGQAMLGYAFLTSVIALASHLSNVFGSWLNVQMGWHFAQVVSLSAALGLPALAVVALLPARLLDRREGKISEEAYAPQRAGAGIPSWEH
jgi:hypothetical protein